MMKTVLHRISLVLLLSTLSYCGEACGEFDKAFLDSYKESFQESCKDELVTQGISEEAANSKCECMAGHLVENFSVKELTEMAANPEKASTSVQQATEACLAE